MRKFCFILVSLAFLASCKKEKTSWTTDWTAPIVHGHLTLDDLLDPQYTTDNSDGYLSIVYHEPVFSFSVDTLIQLPDTVISKKTAIGVPSLSIVPGFAYGDFFNEAYALDQIELKRVIVESGKVDMTITSPWPGKAKLIFDFPKILENGNPFSRTFNLPAGTQTNPSVQTESIDMTGFDMDLTGVSGLLFNTLSGDIIVGSDESVTTYDVTNSDSIEYAIQFSNILPRYAKGYFGSYVISDTAGFDLPFMNSIIAGSIDIDSIDLNLSIKNGFNLIATSKVTLFKAFNSNTGATSELMFPDLGNSININPATGDMWNYTPSEYPISVNNANSNIIDFIETLPDSIYLGYELMINPFGNVTAGSDELFPGSELELFLDGEFPLSFGANDLTIVDTLNLSYNGSGSYTGENAVINLDYVNGFPLEANATIYLLDGAQLKVDSITTSDNILAGTYDSNNYTTSPTSGSVALMVNSETIELLETTDQLLLKVSFSSYNTQNVKINSDAYFDFNLRSNLQISLHL